MKDENNLKKILPFLIIALVIGGTLFVYRYIKRNDGSINNNHIVNINKKYDVNEIVPVYVNDEQMSRKYLNDFLNNIYYDIDNSYALLNIKYRVSKFGSVDKYKEYLNSLDLSNDISKFAVYKKGKDRYYDIYDKNGNRFIFITNGVMQYEVLFDDYTL